MDIVIISFYKFIPFIDEQVSKIQKQLLLLAKKLDGKEILQVRGLTILSCEGINATYSVTSDLSETFMLELCQLLQVESLPFKVSKSVKHAFHDFKIKVRSEIVTLERPDLVPQGEKRHLSPKEWHDVIDNEAPLIIDTRNSYEYDVGHFKGAINPKTEEFSEFPDWLKKTELPKNKKILIYCTGGIRCEKAILEMEEQGYHNVYQLDGGILKYLEDYKSSKAKSHFDGECFVFDYRIAVDHDLTPTQTYRLCPHCGQPAKTKIDCIQCDREDTVCESCLEKGAQQTGDIQKSQFRTCSKNCAHHFRMGHKSRRVHQDAFNRRVIAD